MAGQWTGDYLNSEDQKEYQELSELHPPPSPILYISLEVYICSSILEEYTRIFIDFGMHALAASYL